MRSSAILALRDIGDTLAVEPIINMLKDGDVRESAVWASGHLGDKRAVEPLIEVLENGSIDVYAVALALAKMGDKRAVEPLIKAMVERPLMGLFDAFEVLVKMGKPAVEPLIKSLKYEDPKVREWAARGLGEIGDIQAIESLRKILEEDKNEDVREATSNALEELKE